MPARISDTGVLVGQRVREARMQQQRTVAQIAKQVKCTGTHLYDIEAGKRQPSLALLKDLCRALQVSADRLLGLTEE